MWKLAFIGSCLLFCMFEAVPPDGGERLCDTNYECEPKECCVSFATPRAGGPQQHKRGRCEPLGKLGSSCVVPYAPAPDIYYYACPCCESHTCKGTQPLPSVGEIGTCGEKRCTKCSDCQSTECCVIDSQGKGATDGTCQPMGKLGEECLVENGSGKPHGPVSHSCPCKNPLTCVTDTGLYGGPSGKLGICDMY